MDDGTAYSLVSISSLLRRQARQDELDAERFEREQSAAFGRRLSARRQRLAEQRSLDTEWNQLHPARTRVRSGAQVVPYDREGVFARDGWICQLCRQEVDPLLFYPDPMCASIDHITPLSAYGDDAPWNVQLAHLKCNVDANDKGHRKRLL